MEGLTVQQVNEGSPARWALVSRDSVLSAEARYGTLVHELAHLYCGHLGTPNGRWWPDRQNLSHAVREFEAESVSYLVCTRLGIGTASDEYLAGYVRRCPATPPISLDRVMRSVLLLEQNGASELGSSENGKIASRCQMPPNGHLPVRLDVSSYKNFLATVNAPRSSVSSAIFCASMTSPATRCASGTKHQPACRRPALSNSRTFAAMPW